MAATLACNGITVTNTFAVQLDRDNIGTGMKAYEVIGTDGAGNVIYGGSLSQSVGTVIPQPPVQVPWMTAPQYNPLTLRIVSLAGNGLPQQVLVSFSGPCLQHHGAYSKRMGDDHLFVNCRARFGLFHKKTQKRSLIGRT
jgi:hypothetical protein